MCFKCLGEGCEQCENGLIAREGMPEMNNHGLNLFHSYKWLKNHNTFPIRGGVLNQSAKFIHAVEWCDLVSSKYHKAEQQNENEKRRLIALNKRKSNGR